MFAEGGYDEILGRATRRLAREALIWASRGGLELGSCYYVTFRTDMEGTTIPGWLKASYPRAMTIVLQHEFEDLEADGEGFSVSLKFGGRKARLWVRYEAVASFRDTGRRASLHAPAVLLGLEGAGLGGAEELGEGDAGKEERKGGGEKGRGREREKGVGGELVRLSDYNKGGG